VPCLQFGAAGAAVTGKTMTVTQSTPKAILNWADFNIANGYKVDFKQPGATSAVLNKIWSADPSVIAGALTANGQVYLYNQNGIVFDKGAQVDVGGLVASTLNFAPTAGSSDPDALFKSGLLSGNSAPVAVANTLPAVFQTTIGADGKPVAGAVTINAGAAINSTEGGRILLIGSAVKNDGTITAPGGQAILAAGNTVYLAASTDPALRGLLIEVNAGGTNSTVTNEGQISTPRGNVTLAGMVVNQAGQVSATTSVSANGSIYLVAGDTSSTADTAFYQKPTLGFGALLPNQGGQLTLAPGSVTEVLPDAADKGTISEQNLANGNFIPSQVALVGETVALQGNASVHAPGATVSLSAATDPHLQLTNPNQATHDGGRIYLDSGSSIDVSGLADVSVPVTRNIVQVTLEGNDLQDDPLLRDGILHGAAVTVDVNKGSTLFNVSPYAGNIGLGVDEVLTKAGTIRLNSDGDVIARGGSTLNVSGGSVSYQGGYGAGTTKLLGANGKTYDISNAPNNVEYIGFANSYSYTDPTWGTKTQLNPQTYYAGYIQGASAGSIEVLGPQVYLRGSMLATTVAGPYQRAVNTLPGGGAFDLGCACQFGQINDYRAPAVDFSDGAADILGANFNYSSLAQLLPADLQDKTALSPTALSQGGFNKLTVWSNGAVTLPAGSELSLAAAGTLAITSLQSVDIRGSIHAPAATVSLATQSVGEVDPAHDVNLGANAVIDVRGAWINDSPAITNVQGTAPLAIDGGSITLSALGDVTVAEASRLDVSGGGWINSSNQLTAGKAGTIALSGSFQEDKNAPYTGAVKLGSNVSLDGASLSAGKGGTLSITSGSITIGPEAAGTPGELFLTPGFFAHRGFAAYNFTGQNSVLLGSAAAGNQPATLINPIQENLAFTGNSLLEPTGSSLYGFASLQSLPATQRSAASISFTATAKPLTPGGADSGDILLGRNASILTDPGASVSLAAKGGSGSITVLGDILAPAGNITLSISGSSAAGYLPDQAILLGPEATLAATGFARIDTLDRQGYREGSVLAGGRISLQANSGYVITDAGSAIDVSGAAGVLDIVNSSGVTPTVVAGNAGSIAIDAREGIILQGRLAGQPARYNGSVVSGAGAGSVTIGLDLFDYGSTVSANASQQRSPYSLDPRTLTLTSKPSYELVNYPRSGTAMISAATIDAGGFDNVTLKSADIVAVEGAVTLSAKSSVTLDAPVLQGNAGSSLQINSARVALGNYFNQSLYFDIPQTQGSVANPNIGKVIAPACAAPGQCAATLAVNAQLIDIRGISGWGGFQTETLTSSGDIRLSSAQNVINTPPALQVPAGDTSTAGLRSGLNVTGDLTLQAQQVYPATAADFTITAQSSVTIKPAAGTAMTPLSAGGILTINAPTIAQYGVLRAPFGEITLNGTSVALESGSLTSVSADGLLIPYGSTLNGQQWTYSPTADITNISNAPPAKLVNLNGADVSVSKGAKVDLSGGGDLYAYEWIAGPGGSKDVLASSGGTYQYAIVPTLGSQFAPLDAQLQLGSAATGVQTVYLSGVPGLAGGTYALLPARYALLPGAYAISVVKSNSDIAPGSAVKQPGGAYLAAGRLGVSGTDTLDSRTSTILVSSDAVVREQSQYTDSYANTFFSAAAASAKTSLPSLPADAGQLQLSATNSLALDGTINFAIGSFISGTDSSGHPITQQGAGGQVSIQAPNIQVVDSATPAAAASNGALQIDAQSLDNLGAQTVILGASARYTSAGEQITTGSTQSIELDNTVVALTAPEIILAAQNQITAIAGARIDATGKLNRTADTLILQGGGALLRASSGALAPLAVDTSVPQNPAGLLSIGSQANLAATGSLLLYSSGNTTAATDARISAPGLGLYSSRVSLGDVPGGAAAPSGLSLTSQLLGQLTGLTALTLGSTSTIDFYGSVSLGLAGSSSAALQSITLDAWGLDGYGSGDKVLQAGAITFTNSNLGATAPAGSDASGTGSLTLRAAVGVSTDSGQITLGRGSKTLAGFGDVTLDADGYIQAQGTGILSVANTSNPAVPVTLRGSALTAANVSDQSIIATGAVSILPAAASSLALPAAPIGGKLTITGSSIVQNGTIDLPAGVLALHATTGDLVLGQGALARTTGSDQNFSVTHSVAAGGQISLVADQGSVTLASGSTIDVSGVSSSDGTVAGDAGTLIVSAPQGQFTFAGSTLKGGAPQGQSQANFTLDVGSGLAGTGFSGLDTLLSNSGFTGALSIRTRGDPVVNVTDTINARSFQLSADQGSIDVSGSINTSGGSSPVDGGTIALWANSGITLESSARLLANAGTVGPVAMNGTALQTRGGSITLGSTSGYVSVQHGSTIQMQGTGGAETDGSLTVRFPSTEAQSQLQSLTNASVTSRKPIVVEGVLSYQATQLGGAPDAGCGTGGSCDIADMTGLLFADAQAYINNATALAAGLGLSNVQVRPGIDVSTPGTGTSAGDLIVGDVNTAVWDLDSWNAALGAPVNVTLRAAGNLVFNASLSDGFTNTGQAVSGWKFGGSGATADSASYRLTAGADLSAASPLSIVAQPLSPAERAAGTAPNRGNVIVTPGNLIRTGDGSIDIQAGGDLLLGYSFNGYDANNVLQVSGDGPLTSVIYTAGVPSLLDDAQSQLFTPNKANRLNPYTPAYPTGGGDIRIAAVDDLRSAPSAQLAPDWLWRRGSLNSDGSLVAPNKNTTWWVVFGNFQQGIGALGGGNLSLAAGGDMTNISAVIPTTGRLLGASGSLPDSTNSVLTGGGTLSVRAGGDINGGVFEDDWGNASVTAGGALGAGATLGQELPGLSGLVNPDSPTYPIFLLGSGAFDVSARGGARINLVGNSTAMPESSANRTAALPVSYFYTYVPSSTFSVQSTGGDIVLESQMGNLPIGVLTTGSGFPDLYDAGVLPAYPATLKVAALSGDISLLNPVTLFPSATGNLSLLAHDSINGSLTGALTSPFTITMEETSPSVWAGVTNPGTQAGAPTDAAFPEIPLHQNDPQSVYIVAATGDISTSTLNLPKQANVLAGGQIQDLNYNGKNLNPSDVTLIAAGGDINYSTPTTPISNLLQTNDAGINLAGPGYLEVLAGGSLNLGDSHGIVTTGNLTDARLYAGGASVVAGAGFGADANGLRQPAYQSFINTYIAPDAAGQPGTYADKLIAFMQQLDSLGSATLGYSAAYSAFESLTPGQQLPFVAQVLMSELSETGLAHTLEAASYDRGYKAIDTLFPTKDAQGNALSYRGNIDMFFSQIKTEQGGDINLLAPGGSVVVGVPNPPARLDFIKTINGPPVVAAAANLGLLVLGQGKVQGFADQNFDVNQSRILTLEGGDIILWASNGNIDAGRGAKSASGAPPPVVQTDINGNVFVNPINDVSGSGIGQLLTGPGQTAGLVNLIAPRGAVDAGDAGIRVAGNLNIAAVQVIGAGNITVGGTATGVPASDAGALSGALSGANSLGDASKNATDQLSQNLGAAANYEQLTDSLTPSFIAVKMFCLGVECER
jgi:filamentous hemagglutinin